DYYCYSTDISGNWAF
nr:immunoglobulin light chain junction region [Macaca mulatta]MOW18686.1 immunoglobulin light chain junction region [Macaca mulatta]